MEKPPAGSPTTQEPLTYKASGVNIGLATKSLQQMIPHFRKTHSPYMLDQDGQPFASPIALGRLARDLGIQDLTIAPSIDSAGTIPQEAVLALNFFPDGMVNEAYNVGVHCNTDVACGGLRPFFFLDMISSTDMNPDVNELCAKGITDACLELNVMVLDKKISSMVVGGELAQMPGTIVEGQYDIIGVAIGIGDEKNRIRPTERVKPGHLIVGYMVDFQMINGSSLIRKILKIANLGIRDILPPTGKTVAESILKRQPNFAKLVMTQLDAGLYISANSHITGGGLPDNISRNLPEGCLAQIFRNRWPIPKFYQWFQQTGNVPDQDLWKTLNMGVGFAQILPDMDVAVNAISLAGRLGFEGRVIGKIVEGNRSVEII